MTLRHFLAIRPLLGLRARRTAVLDPILLGEDGIALPICTNPAILERMMPWKTGKLFDIALAGDGFAGDTGGNQGSVREALGDEAAATTFCGTSKWSIMLSAALIALSAVAAYHTSFAGSFVYDDEAAIVENPTIRQLWPIWPAFSPPCDGRTVSGRPLLNLSLALNYALDGLDAWGYHALNLAIHIAAAWLLFGIVRRTFLTPALRNRFGRAATPLALASAVLWAVHPLQTESVTYIVQRAESLMGFFYLLTLYCVIRGTGAGTVPFFAAQNPTLSMAVGGEKGDCPPQRCSWLWYAAAVLACLLGMATKEVMVTAPLVVLLYDRTFVAGSFREAWRRRGRLYLGLAAAWCLLAYLVFSTGLIARQFELGAPDAWTYARTQPGVILRYLRLCFWPSRQCVDYYLSWECNAARTLGEILPGAIVIAALLAATLWGMMKRRVWGYLGAWFLLILMPTSSILPLRDLAYEHRMYLSLAAAAVFVVAGGYALWDRLLPRPAPCSLGATVLRWGAPWLVLTAVLLALGSTTVARNRHYRSPVILWQDTLERFPNDATAHNNLGHALASSGGFQEAVAQYHEALRLKPHDANAHYNLGNALARLGRTDEAIEHFQQALRLKPSRAEPHNNLGLTLAAVGRTAEAIGHYREALRVNPELAEAHNNLGNALAALGNTAEAIGHYEDALRLKPDYVKAHYNLATALVKLGRTDEAIEQYNQCLQRMPDWKEALNDLAWLLATRDAAAGGDPTRAVPLAQRACELDRQDNAQCLDTLAAAYAAAGRFADAILTAQRAGQLAESAGQTRLAASIQARLDLYRAARPYRETPDTQGQTKP